MRPLELRLRNFRSYSGEHVFDFRDRKLVGIVGPIGSGKSSILDAIAFSLYGRTPRIGSATRTLINQRATDSGVVLRFEIEGKIWEAARSIRQKGQSKHALYRYESDEAGTEPVEKLLMEGEVNERIIELLGLDFAAFERSVLLAQGRFAEFLQARPADRDKVLKGVFGHDRIDRMKEVAKERRDQASGARDKVEVRLERFDEIRGRLAGGRVEVDEARKRKEELNEVAARLERIEVAMGAAADSAVAAGERLADLEQHAGKLPDPATTTQLLADAVAVAQRRTDLAESLDAAQVRSSAADNALGEANSAGEPELIERVTKLLAAADPQLQAVVDADRRIAAFAKQVGAAKEGLAAAQTAADEAAEVRANSLGRSVEAAKILEEAERALERARHADMAATLRNTLAVDEPCPVCAQPVHELPQTDDATHTAELEKVVAAARKAKKEVDAAHTAAMGALERTTEQVQSAADKLTAGETQLAGARDDAMRIRGDLEETTLQLEKLLGPGDPAEHLAKRRDQYDALVREREDSQRKADQVRGLHDQAIRDEQEGRKALQELGVLAAELAVRLGIDVDVGDDPDSIGLAFEQLRAQWDESTVDLRTRKEAAEAELAIQNQAKADLLAQYEVAGDVEAERAVVADRIARLEESILRDSTELEQAEQLYEQRDGLADQIELFGRINQDLTDSRFVRFLLDEERMRLADLGSEHFQRLSSGRYRFADDKFAIIDLTAADATRRADSLSGGETFLASLGLALALAEMVAGTGGRLDAFFLDEGFGTLDPEHLDLAMEGIEQLVAEDQDRLVVIVSHVPELRLRLGDLIELERSPVTGDTRVISR